MELKNVRRGRIKEYADRFPRARFLAGERPWGVKCDLAFPSATQNEIDGRAAKTLVANGCKCVSEGANMPTTPEGVEVFLAARILYGPGKAANAGGVSVSGLEMTQNAGVVGADASAAARARTSSVMSISRQGDATTSARGSWLGQLAGAKAGKPAPSGKFSNRKRL